MIFDISDKNCIDLVESFTNKRKFIQEFKKRYDFIKAYHATKLSNQEVDSIKQNGLIKASTDLLKQKAINRFIKNSDASDLQKQMLEEIEKFFHKEPPITIGEINFGLVKEDLKFNYYHYLLFGAESLLPLASQLKNRFGLSVRSRMIEFGSSYLIAVKIPVKHTLNLWISCIYEYINNDFIESSLVYYKQLPPENIIEIELVAKPVDRNCFEFM